MEIEKNYVEWGNSASESQTPYTLSQRYRFAFLDC